MLTARELTAALRGRWRASSGTARCPAHEDCDPSLSVAEGRDGRVLVKCFAGCEQEAVIAALRARGLWPGPADRDRRSPGRGRGQADPELERRRRAREAAERRARIDRARRLWREAVPVTPGDPVDRYLRARGLAPLAAGWPPTIRFLALTRHPSGARVPALVAAACRWPERVPSAVACLALDPATAGKAEMKPVRWTVGVLAGAAVRLAPWAPNRKLVITEGVEDALAVARAAPDAAAWAAVGTANVANLALPEDAEVVLCLDGDEPGRNAARRAALALAARGHRVRRAQLPDGTDPAALVAVTGP